MENNNRTPWNKKINRYSANPIQSARRSNSKIPKINKAPIEFIKYRNKHEQLGQKLNRENEYLTEHAFSQRMKETVAFLLIERRLRNAIEQIESFLSANRLSLSFIHGGTVSGFQNQ